MTLPFARASGPAPWPSEPAPESAVAAAKLAAAAAAARRARLVDILWPPQDSPAKRKVGRLNRQEHFQSALVACLKQISSGKQQDRDLPTVAPPWWEPGMGVDAPAPALSSSRCQLKHAGSARWIAQAPTRRKSFRATSERRFTFWRLMMECF